MVLHGIIPSIFYKHPLWVLHKKQHCFGIDAFRGFRNIKRKLVLVEQAKWDLYLNDYAKTFKSLGASFTK